MKNIVIRLDADIVPGKSIGGVSLSDNVSDVIRCINGSAGACHPAGMGRAGGLSSAD